MDADSVPVSPAKNSANTTITAVTNAIRRRWRFLNSGSSDFTFSAGGCCPAGAAARRRMGLGVRRPMLVPGMVSVRVPCSRASIRLRRSRRSRSALFTALRPLSFENYRYATSSKNKPLAGSVCPARRRSRLCSSGKTESGVRLCSPASTKVPARMRTILYR